MTLFNNSIDIVTTNGTYVDGIWQESGSVTSTILGTVQVVSSEEYSRLPEGRKEKGVVKIYTDASLKALDKENNSTGDIVFFDGRKWEVGARLPYKNGLINHNKYLAYLVVEPEGM